MKETTKALYKTALENLQEANRLLRRDRWIKNRLAVDCNGRVCSPRSPEARAFCALGAVRFIDGPGEKSAVRILGKAAEFELGKKSSLSGNNAIFEVNDYLGYDAVKSMFRRALKLARK